MTLQIPVKLMDKIIEDKVENLEIQLETLLHQKSILQSIEKYSNNRLDFGDLLETYKLLTEKIERMQEEVRRLKSVSTIPVGKESEEDEEEEDSSLSSKYNIEHVIEENGQLRPATAEDLDMEKNKAVRDAFKMLYEWQKEKQKKDKEYEEEEEEEETLHIKDVVIRYVNHKYIIKAVNRILEQKKAEKGVCGICKVVKPKKELTTDLVCKDCDDAIRRAVEIGSKMLK